MRLTNGSAKLLIELLAVHNDQAFCAGGMVLLFFGNAFVVQFK